MKKILIALAVTVFAGFSAEAQAVKACGAPEGQVCRKGGSCYKTKYAENYAICKSDYGYYVCCEVPNNTNSTFPALPLAALRGYPSPNGNYYAMQSRDKADGDYTGTNQDMTAPQSQSYPAYSANVATSYEGYYRTNHIRVCSNSDNVADENRAPYNGCPSPAYDGPDKNIQRNVNESTPNVNAPLAPITGKSK